MKTETVIELAERHLRPEGTPGASNDWHCYEEAVLRLEQGMRRCAKTWAIKSLAHSVGILHPDYQAAVINRTEA